MDKLKPLLTHKFWIIFALALIVPVVGWWMATGAWATNTESRWTTLEGVKVPSTATEPNDKWKTGIDGVIEVRQQLLRNAGETLWNKQNSLRTWPAYISHHVKDIEPGGEIPKTARENYRRNYFVDLERILNIAEPITSPVGRRLVDVTEENVHHVPREEFRVQTPTSQKMWETQEDLWLLESIMKAVANVNQTATDASNASVLTIMQASLHGGSRAAEGAAGGDPAAGGAPAGPGMSPMMGGGGSSFGIGGSSRGGGGAGATSVDVQPQDVFGPDTITAAAGGDMAAGGSPSPMPMSGPMGSGGGNQPVRRYVDDNPADPFKTRGFILKVTMDHRKVPDLLANLASIQWPVQILVVNQQIMNEGKMAVSGSRGGGNVAGMRPGGRSPMAMPARVPGGAFSGLGRGPMGIPRLPGGNGFGATANTERDEATETAQRRHEQALSDASVATVVIAGLMTIYQPPQISVGQQVGQPEPPATDPSATDPAVTEPPATAPDGTVPVEPGTDPNALPAEPATGTPATETPGGTVPPMEPGLPGTPGGAEASNPPEPPVPPATTPENGTEPPAGETPDPTPAP